MTAAPSAEKRSKRMKSRPSIYTCGCLDKVNKALAERNTVVETCFTMNFTTGKQGEALLLHTGKVDPRKRDKPLKVEVNFCPWCGVRYE